MSDPVIIRVFRKPHAVAGPYAELEERRSDRPYYTYFSPVHAADMEARARKLLKENRGFDTVSSLALDIVGYLIRTGDLPLPVHVHYCDADNEVRIIQYDSKGDFVEPWPEGPPLSGSIHDAGFYYRLIGYDSVAGRKSERITNCPPGPVFG